MKSKLKFLLILSCPGLLPLLAGRWARLWVYLLVYLGGAIVHASLPENWWTRANLFFSIQVLAILLALNLRDLFWRSFRRSKELVFNRVLMALYFYCVVAIGLLYVATGPNVTMVEDESMYSTLKRGDYVSYWKEDGIKWKRGDLVLFIHPTEGKKIFRRLVAFGGDHITTKDGIIYVNSIPMTEQDLGALPVYNLPDVGFMVIPEGKVLWIAENNEDSAEKGTWGLAKVEDLKGRGLWIQNSKDEKRIGTDLRLSKNILD